VVVLVLAQWHYARIIAAAVPLLRSENPVSSQIEKLIPDSQVEKAPPSRPEGGA
jgi:hypothetical protein